MEQYFPTQAVGEMSYTAFRALKRWTGRKLLSNHTSTIAFLYLQRATCVPIIERYGVTVQMCINSMHVKRLWKAKGCLTRALIEQSETV